MQLFTPPTTHRDLLRIMPKSDLKELSDVVFVNQVLQLMISEDPHGYTRTGNITIPQLLTLFATREKISRPTISRKVGKK
jgi:hypothetical protein